ncbi:hypothetical protein NKH28_30580 [Mesorhizobium sp. M1227]|uniref:hypothetical protein n=1 Tax=Mesorhizobium sp. M1227 TaxID=2957071 RepID=UPI00333AECCE
MNHFHIYLHDRDGVKRFIVREMTQEGVRGLWFDDPRGQPQDRLVTNEELKSLAVSFLHTYRNARFTYTTPLSLFRALATFYPARSLWWDNVLQRQFNKQELVRGDRMRVLRHFVQKNIQQPDYHPSVVTVIADIYTARSVLHPRYDQTETHYSMILDSLVHSKDLMRNGAIYSMTNQAVITLENMETEKERHDDNMRQQSRIGWLTAALIALTIIQAGIAVWGELNPDPSPIIVQPSTHAGQEGG